MADSLMENFDVKKAIVQQTVDKIDSLMNGSTTIGIEVSRVPSFKGIACSSGLSLIELLGTEYS